MLNRLNKFFLNLEWRLALGTTIWLAVFPAGSFALPFWAARASGVFSKYAPLSWVACGFGGLLIYAIAVALMGLGRCYSVRSKYDARFMQETGGIDPLAKVFEGKRIYLNDLVLPSNTRVMEKTFVGCEIVGPANIYLERNNNINRNNSGNIDAVVLSGLRQFSNGITFADCVFKDCSFHRVTVFMNPDEVEHGLTIPWWLNWITPMPVHMQAFDDLIPIEDQSGQLPEASEEETLR
jgi:hypothetical protein